MVEQVLLRYVQPCLMVIGLIEFVKKGTDKKMEKKFYMILQLILCAVAGILVALKEWTEGFTGGLVVLMLIETGMLISLTMLFYELLVKKIKALGKGKYE